MFTVSENMQFQIMEGSVLQLNKNYVQSDNAVSEFSYEKYSVPGPTVDMALNMARITTTRYIYIVSDKDISIKLGSISNTAIGPTKFVMLNVGTGSVYISNAGSQAASVDVVLAGV
jgi:hypothetical protein